MNPKVGVLLLNLGTPESPEPKDVAKYLREFLMDKYVIDIPAFFRWVLVNLIIVPFRAKRSSHAYKSIWSQKGSPIMFHTKSLAEELSPALGENFVVQYGMRYGRPHVARAFRTFLDQQVEKVVVIPLYPQYAESTTRTAFERIQDVIDFSKFSKPVVALREFYQTPEFLDAETEIYSNTRGSRHFDHTVFSFHGLPVRHIQKVAPESKQCLTEATCTKLCNSLCYRGQCYLTAKAIAEKAGLLPDEYTVTFQSRLGRDKWLEPSTSSSLKKLALDGKKNVVITCPSFTSDCLETLEEIGITLREEFLSAGGENLQLVPCLNAKYEWVPRLAQLVKRSSKNDETLKDLLVTLSK